LDNGQKKPAWKKSTGRDHIVPGLFSDLFNVAASRPAQITTEQVMPNPARAFRQANQLTFATGLPQIPDANAIAPPPAVE
jgi:hypothetical protein